MSKLKRFGDQVNLPLMEAQIENTKKAPVCPKCQNYGYVNCPQAKALNGGDYLAVAFQEGTACDCGAGQEFAKNQMEWLRPDRVVNA